MQGILYTLRVYHSPSMTRCNVFYLFQLICFRPKGTSVKPPFNLALTIGLSHRGGVLWQNYPPLMLSYLKKSVIRLELLQDAMRLQLTLST